MGGPPGGEVGNFAVFDFAVEELFGVVDVMVESWVVCVVCPFPDGVLPFVLWL